MSVVQEVASPNQSKKDILEDLRPGRFHVLGHQLGRILAGITIALGLRLLLAEIEISARVEFFQALLQT